MVILIATLFLAGAYADTINLKNGRSVEGIIAKEDPNTITLNVGEGMVVFKKNEIANISKSTPEEINNIKNKWQTNKSRAEQANQLAIEQKEKSWLEWQAKDAQREAEKKRLEAEKEKLDAKTKTVDITSDEQNNYLMVNVILNGSVPATLIIDTGCPTMMLTTTKAEELGLNLSRINKTAEVMVLNGTHKIGRVVLDSIKLGDVEEKDVEADVLLDYDEDLERGCKDGLLGLSLLKRFHFTLDHKNGKIILRKDEG